jgi:hypothetical protein
MTIFYCLRFETHPTWRARSPYLYPPGTGWPSYTSRHWVPFSSPPTTRRTTVEVFEPASTRNTNSNYLLYPFITPRHGPRRKHSLSIFLESLFTHPLLSNGSVRHNTCIFLHTQWNNDSKLGRLDKIIGVNSDGSGFEWWLCKISEGRRCVIFPVRSAIPLKRVKKLPNPSTGISVCLA